MNEKLRKSENLDAINTGMDLMQESINKPDPVKSTIAWRLVRYFLRGSQAKELHRVFEEGHKSKQK